MTQPVEMRIPFAIGGDGSISVETNPDRQIGQRVRALVGTQPGERAMNVEIGIPLAGLLFDLDDEITKQDLLQRVTDLLSVYEPGAHILRVFPLPDESGDGIAAIQVEYTRTESASTPARLAQGINTALITVGGKVSEVVRG